MARKKKTEEQRIAEQIKKLLPPGLIPDSYLEYVVMENKEVCDSQDEMLAEVKMQLYEESGFDLPLTRDEMDSYMYDTVSDERWESMNRDGMVSASQVKMIEDSNDKTMLELIREMPLIPAARIVSSIVVSYLHSHGVQVSQEEEESITDSLIHSLDTSFSEMTMGAMDFGFDMDTEDDFSLPFGWKPDNGQDAADSETPPQVNKEEPRTVRRSRITRFPGKK